jgi:MFS family permease
VHKETPRISDGFRYVRSVPLISTTLIMMAVIGTFGYEFSVSLPLLAQQTFRGGATAYAALTSTFGVGSAMGGLFSAGRHQMSSRQLITFAFLFGVTLLVAAITPTLEIAIVVLVLVGFFSINMTAIANTTIQLESRPDMRGRVMALWSMAIFGSTPIGGPLIGFIGEHFGARWGLVTGGVATIMAAAFAARTLSKSGMLRTVSPQIELEAEEETLESGKF